MNPAFSRLSLPVRVPSSNGFNRSEAMLVLERGRLEIELPAGNRLVNWLSGERGVRALEIPIMHIESVHLRHGMFWLSPYLEFEFNSARALAQLSGVRDGRWRAALRLERKSQAQRWADALRHAMAVNLHQRIDDSMSGAQENAQTQTPPPLPNGNADQFIQTAQRWLRKMMQS